jgi:hypothetical protein
LPFKNRRETTQTSRGTRIALGARPGTLALLGLGMFGIGLARRRQRA